MKSSRTSQHAGRASRVPFALLVTGLIAGGMGLLLLLNTASAANEVQRHDITARDASIAAQVQELQNEVAASAAPGNLSQAAAALGMVPAVNPAFLVVATDGAVRVLGSPAAAAAVVVPVPTPHTKQRTTSASKSATASTTAKATGTAHSSTTPAHSTAQSSPTHTPAPTPTHTPTPTPTLTLPGGNR